MKPSRRRFPFCARPVALAATFAALFLAGGAGCAHPGRFDSARTGPFFEPPNVFSEPSLAGVRRVVVLPVWTGTVAPVETAADLDPVLIAALQEQHRFEVVTVPRHEARRLFRADALSSASALPHNLLPTLRRDYAADAVLFVDVTVYRGYRPIALGLRAKLATTDGTRLLWTFDNVFSADDPAVANSARRHFLNSDRRVPVDLSHGVLQSPSRFAAYASATMFATLPPVIDPLATAAVVNSPVGEEVAAQTQPAR